MSRSKEKVTKENSQFKVHISELVAQIEILSQEKISMTVLRDGKNMENVSVKPVTHYPLLLDDMVS